MKQPTGPPPPEGGPSSCPLHSNHVPLGERMPSLYSRGEVAASSVSERKRRLKHAPTHKGRLSLSRWESVGVRDRYPLRGAPPHPPPWRRPFSTNKRGKIPNKNSGPPLAEGGPLNCFVRAVSATVRVPYGASTSALLQPDPDTLARAQHGVGVSLHGPLVIFVQLLFEVS